MKNNSSWETDSGVSIQVISRLWSPKFHYSSNSSLPLVRNMNQLNQVHTAAPRFSKFRVIAVFWPRILKSR
jgi:hypothetical protein